jgi:hypothetical protein
MARSPEKRTKRLGASMCVIDADLGDTKYCQLLIFGFRLCLMLKGIESPEQFHLSLEPLFNELASYFGFPI